MIENPTRAELRLEIARLDGEGNALRRKWIDLEPTADDSALRLRMMNVRDERERAAARLREMEAANG